MFSLILLKRILEKLTAASFCGVLHIKLMVDTEKLRQMLKGSMLIGDLGRLLFTVFVKETEISHFLMILNYILLAKLGKSQRNYFKLKKLF